jgi:hypothetical protein
MTEVHVETVKPARECQCGCGSPTKNRFAMGHDAKLKGRLINEALDFESGNKGRKSSPAHKQLAALGWTSHLDKSRESRKAKAERKAADAKAKAQREREAKAKPKAKRQPKVDPTTAPGAGPTVDESESENAA